MHTCRLDPIASFEPFLSIQFSAFRLLQVLSCGAVYKERAGKKCGRAWEASFALSSAENPHCDAWREPSCASVPAFCRCPPGGTCPCVPSASCSSPGAQSRGFCRAVECGWTAFRDEIDHCGTVALQGFIFEGYHLEIWPISSFKETSWWSSPV